MPENHKHGHCCPDPCPPQGGPFPLEFSPKAPYVAGIDKDGYPFPITPGHGVLYGPTGSKVAEWRDGSDAKPLVFPNIVRTTQPKQSVIVRDSSGRLWALDAPEGKKKRLVSEAGAVFFDDDLSSKPVFAASDVGVANCSYDVAVFGRCDSADSIKLLRVPLSSFNNSCDQSKEVSLGDYIIVCSGGEQRVIKPQKGYMLAGVLDGEGIPRWGLSKVDSNPVVGAPVIFRYTGSVQILTVPAGASVMKVKCWGAWGSTNSYYAGGTTSGGGYTYAEFPVSGGTQFAVVVGAFGGAGCHGCANNVLYPGVYGFGGGWGYNGVKWFVPGGGGLSGLFTGTSEPSAGERARALIIAGGGSGSSIFNGVSSANEGGNGSGGQPSMAGATCPLSVFGSSGGGGYAGGNITNNGGGGGGGGTAFVAASGNNAVALPGAPHASGNASDADYEATSNNGLVVVRFESVE